jgi:hypothetical protein
VNNNNGSNETDDYDNEKTQPVLSPRDQAIPTRLKKAKAASGQDIERLGRQAYRGRNRGSG